LFCLFCWPLNIHMRNTVFQLTTLVDITATGVVRSAGQRDTERNQQRNWETVLQVLGLRTQPHVITFPYQIKFAESDTHRMFGTFNTGDHTVWRFEFGADQPGAYGTEHGATAGLLTDFEEVPVITGLTETARFMLPIFYPHGAIKNLHLVMFPKA